MNSEIFTRQIKNILVDNRLTRYVGRQRSGDIDFKCIYRAGFTNKVFKKKAEAGNKEYHVLLMVDCSYSMTHDGGYKLATVKEVLPEFYATFSDLVDITVVGFNCTLHEINVDGKVSAPEMVNRVHNAVMNKTLSCGNHDGYLIAQAYKKYLRHKKGHKTIITLSDGQPHCDNGRKCSHPGGGQYCDEHMTQDIKDTIQSIRKEGVECIGIGMKTGAVKNFYSVCSEVHDLPQLYQAVIEKYRPLIRKPVIG